VLGPALAGLAGPGFLGAANNGRVAIMTMRILLTGAALAALAAGPALAADLGRPAPAPVYTKAPPVPTTYNWTGFYIGADGGYGWGTSNGTLTNAAGASLAPYSYNVNGPIAGGFIGGNYQINQFVIGLEGDWQWADLTGNGGSIASLGAGGPFAISTTVNDYGSIRGRLGVAFDRFLVFGTGGWAWGNFSTSYVNGAVALGSVGGNSSNGWTAGGGVEYAFTDNILGRIEYRYTNLGSASGSPALGFAEAGNNVTINDVRAGIAYKFGGGPLLGRY
jgi:outer membrane immunogenic protein